MGVGTMEERKGLRVSPRDILRLSIVGLIGIFYAFLFLLFFL